MKQNTPNTRLSLLCCMLTTFYWSSRALDDQGRVYIAGYTNTTERNLRDTLFAVSRYNNQGVDTTFGDGGISVIEDLQFGFGMQAFTGPLRHGVATDIVLLFEAGEFKIYAIGVATDLVTGLPRAILVKFNQDGSVDTSFNNNLSAGGPGYLWLAEDRSVATAIGILENPDPSLVVAYNVINDSNRYQGMLASVTTSGQKLVFVEQSSQDVKFNALTVVSEEFDQGSFIVGKSIAHGTPIPYLAFVGLGVPFNELFLTTISGEFRAIAPQSIPNRVLPSVNLYAVGVHANKALLAKFQALGNTVSLDTSFGQGGFITAEFGTQQTEFNAIKITNDARIFVCGTARSLQSRMFIAEYDQLGNLVTSFGTNGIEFINGGQNIQTFGQQVVLQNPPPARQFFDCSSHTGLFAVGRANNQTPLIASLSCSGGQLRQTEYGDKGINSLITEELTQETILREQLPSGQSLPTPGNSPFTRHFNTLLGNPFAVTLSTTGSKFTLMPGRYSLQAQAPISDVLAHKLQLWNLTLGQQEDIGNTIWNSRNILSEAFLQSIIFVSEPTDFELRHWFSKPGPDFSPGEAVGVSGLDEVYAQMSIEQL